MAIGARLETQNAVGNQRAAPRRRLHLAATAAKLTGQSVEVLIHNISEDGLLIETDADLSAGETVDLLLPRQQGATARIIWSSGRLFGCRFDVPLSRAALSAAQLQSATPRESSDHSRLQEESRPADPGDPETFGARLRRLRQTREISLIGLARAVGVSKPTVWKWERGEVRPREGSLARLSIALGVTEQDLLAGEGAPEKPKTVTSDETRFTSRLAEDINECKDRIARSAGTRAENVTITIRF